MKKFFSLVLALVMALSLTTVAWGATLQDAIDAAVDGTATTITLDADTTESIVIPAGKVIVLDLNGKTLSYTSTAAAASCAIDNKGTLTIKNGTVTYAGVGDPNFGYGTNTINNTGKLTIDGATIINTTDSGSSVAIDCAAGAELIVNSGEIKSEKNAIRLCPFGAAAINCTINGGTITGARAIQIQLPSNNPASAPDINLTVTGGTLNGTSGLSIYSYSAGQGVDNVDITLSGGVYNNDVAFGGGNAKTTQENVTVTGGTFNSGFYTYNDTIDDEITISGGTFSTDVSEYVADGSRFDAATGEVTAMPATGVGKYDLYDANGDLYKENITVEYVEAYDDEGAGNIEYYKLTYDGVTYTYFVECSRTKAECYLTLADNLGAYKHLKHVDYVDYVATGKAYTNIGDDCGELDVSAKAKAYVVTDEDGVKTYFVASASGQKVIKVGNELVAVNEVVGGLVPHVWVVTAYNDKEEPATVKCKNCPATGKLYATKLAAPIGATFDDTQVAGYWVVVNGSTAPSTDKVQSAETFDAGIAMYVGMSVMAAAGSAVVIGKKRED